MHFRAVACGHENTEYGWKTFLNIRFLKNASFRCCAQNNTFVDGSDRFKCFNNFGNIKAYGAVFTFGCRECAALALMKFQLWPFRGGRPVIRDYTKWLRVQGNFEKFDPTGCQAELIIDIICIIHKSCPQVMWKN